MTETNSYVLDVAYTKDGFVRLLDRRPISGDFAVRLPSGRVHTFPTRAEAEASPHWPREPGEVGVET